MVNMLEKIENVLQSEVEMHITIIASSKEFNSALRKGDLEMIDRQRLAQDEAICTIERLENERMEYCTAAAEKLGIFKKPLRLSMLLAKVPGEWSVRLEKIQAALKEKIGELASVNVSNRILLEDGLKMIGNKFSILRHAEKKYAGYGHQGQTTASPAVRSIINKTV